MLLLPSAELSSCIALGVVRDTRGIRLDHADRFSHFPASPYVSLTLCLSGETFVVDDGRIAEAPFTPLTLSGPKAAPLSSYTPGPVLLLTLGFYPGASEGLFGIKAGSLKDQHVPLNSENGGDLSARLAELLDCADATKAFRRLEEIVKPLWRDKRPRDGIVPAYFQDWLRYALIRMVTSQTGRGIRQMQRRVRNFTGHSQRDLEQFARMEALFSHVVRVEGEKSYAEIAVDAGYADQSHMGRDVRRLTGYAPAEIMRRIDREESFWFYRLMADYFGQIAG